MIINDLIDASSKVKQLKKGGKKIGLITGSFDFVHYGHIQYFQLAKKYVDILFIGIDSDNTIIKSKKILRPINNLSNRMKFIVSLEFVDFVFPLKFEIDNNLESSDYFYTFTTKKLNPNAIFTHVYFDNFKEQKEKRAQKLRLQLFYDDRVE